MEKHIVSHLEAWKRVKFEFENTLINCFFLL